MKHTRQIFALVLALVLTLGLCATAFADEAKPGSITISNPAQGKTYEVFKLLDVAADESDLANNGFIYKLTADAWADFITNVQDGSGENYFNFFENGGTKYVLANENLKPGIADFAAKAKAYAEEKKLQPVQTATASDGNELTISGLDLGYYLVRSDLGILCSLDTTAPNAQVKEKNEATVIVKNVEDTEKQNVAEIGTYVKFTIQITVNDKAPVNYKLVDEMTEGLTFVNDENHPLTVKVTRGESESTLTNVDDYTVAETSTPKGFTLKFKDEGSASILKTGDVVTVNYYAQINEKAVVADEANVNKAKVEYGTNSHTEYDTTETYVWKMNIVKYTMEQETEKKLAGATFQLSRDEAGAQVIKLVKVDDTTYRLALPTDTAVDTITTGETGELVINGLADGTYYLTETKAPRGYNLLREPVKVTIGHNKNANGKLTETSFVANQTETDTSGLVKVENNAGAELPSTGGIGTTVFYVLGSAMALGAVILLVTKKRMAA